MWLQQGKRGGNVYSEQRVELYLLGSRGSFVLPIPKKGDNFDHSLCSHLWNI